MKIKIAIVDTIGLQYDGDTLNKIGLGGSESAVIYITKELAKIGFEVYVFNDCNGDYSSEGVYDGVTYLELNQSNIDNYSNFDVIISSRSAIVFSPKEYLNNFINKQNIDYSNFIKNSKKIVWLHDTFCQGDNILEHLVETSLIDCIFTLSDFHTNYITNCNHGNRRNFEVLKNKIFQTRNGINRFIDWVDISKKDKNLFVYNASTSKGLVPLIEYIWPEIKKYIPDARLKVIGGFYRFKNSLPDEQELKYNTLVQSNPKDVEFTGIIPQNKIAEILAEASFMLYPASFPETFGISTLESLNYNTPLLTCRFGALEETAIDSACYKIPYAIEPNSLFPNINREWQNMAFVNMVVKAYNNTYLHQQKMYLCNKVKNVSTWDTVALQWKQKLFKILDLYLPIDDYREVSKINYKVKEVFGRKFSNNEDNIYYKDIPEREIIVISTVYNGEKYIRKCIESVMAQDYNNFTHYIIDDGSTDNTLQAIYNTRQDLKWRTNGHKIIIHYNDVNNGSALGNQINLINKLNDEYRYNNIDPIIVLLDGDDYLYNDPNIFNKLNQYYEDLAEMTYGSCWSVCDNIPLIAQEYPPEVKKNKSYKKHLFNWAIPYTHLRTFALSLFRKINFDNLKDKEGNWLKAGGDAALFYELIEKANPKYVYAIPDILSYYNDTNPICDYKINSEEQKQTLKYILER